MADGSVIDFYEPPVIDTFGLDPNHRSFKAGDSIGPDSRADILLSALGDSGESEDFWLM